MSNTELNSTNEIGEQILLVSRSTYLGAAGVLVVIGVVGCFFNFTVILVILRDAHHLLTPVNVVLLNLVIGDFSVAVLGTPFVIVSSFMGEWHWGHEGCIWYAWFMSALGMAGIGNLTVLAVERWLLVTRPMKAFTIRQASYLVFGVWVYALTLTIPPLIGWGSYGPEAANLSCSVSWEVHDPTTGTASYIAFLFFFGLAVPVVAISGSYLGIVRTLKKAKRRAGSRGRYEAKVTKMVAIMIIAFLTAWTPYAALAFAAQYFQVEVAPSVAILPSILAKSSICYNPIIYVGMNTQFRDVILKCLGSPEHIFARTSGVSEPTGVSGANRITVKPLQIDNN